ncbi:MAG: PAS domain-containing protein, partial [Aestuariivirgaceae bacterium]
VAMGLVITVPDARFLFLARGLQGLFDGTGMTQKSLEWGREGEKGWDSLRIMDELSSTPEIAHSGARNLFRYWESIRKERSAPLRSDIGLHGIRQLLPWIFIAERNDDSGHRLRLAGTGICRLWGANMTGRDLFERWPGFERHTMARLLDSASRRRQPFVMRCRAKTDGGRRTSLEIIGLPVEADDTGTTQVLGLVIPLSEPDWLRHEPLTSFELTSIRIIWTEPVPSQGKAPDDSLNKPSPPFQVIQGGLSR